MVHYPTCSIHFLWQGYKLEVVDIPSLPDDSAPIGVLSCDYYR